jgi:CRP-like cAMP-binding protein
LQSYAWITLCRPLGDALRNAARRGFWTGALTAPTGGGRGLVSRRLTQLGGVLAASGGVRLVRCTLGGNQIATHTVRRGEFFAEAALFSKAYHCDAVASEPSEVLVFPKDALVHQLRASPEMLWAFSAELAKRVQGLRTRLEIQQTRSADERILQFIHLHCDASGFWAQRGTLKHLAEEIGLTHEALYRALARLQRQGLILRKKAGLQLAR